MFVCRLNILRPTTHRMQAAAAAAAAARRKHTCSKHDVWRLFALLHLSWPNSLEHTLAYALRRTCRLRNCIIAYISICIPSAKGYGLRIHLNHLSPCVNSRLMVRTDRFGCDFFSSFAAHSIALCVSRVRFH